MQAGNDRGAVLLDAAIAALAGVPVAGASRCTSTSAEEVATAADILKRLEGVGERETLHLLVRPILGSGRPGGGDPLPAARSRAQRTPDHAPVRPLVPCSLIGLC